jgi:epoxyqueuosine reductase
MLPQDTYHSEVHPEPAAVFQACGLHLLGIAPAKHDSAASERYGKWLAQERHGDMQWLERHADRKYDPERILPGCQSILVVGLSYYQPGEAANLEGRVARYAWGRDYHKVLGNRLRGAARLLGEHFPADRFRGYTDAVALDERHYAALAGAGFMGRNTLLIHSALGSWFVIGEVLSTRAWPATPLAEPRHGACPQGCRKCLDVCPTGALTAAGEIDARRCISYLTIEHKGPIPMQYRVAMGNWLFGCDRCQEVCPFQLRKQVTAEADFLAWRAGPGLAPADILGMDESTFRARFSGTPILRTGHWRMQRNACIVAGNLQDAASLAALTRLAGSDADPVLQEHALWALARYDRER